MKEVYAILRAQGYLDQLSKGLLFEEARANLGRIRQHLAEEGIEVRALPEEDPEIIYLVPSENLTEKERRKAYTDAKRRYLLTELLHLLLLESGLAYPNDLRSGFSFYLYDLKNAIGKSGPAIQFLDWLESDDTRWPQALEDLLDQLYEMRVLDREGKEKYTLRGSYRLHLAMRQFVAEAKARLAAEEDAKPQSS